MSDNHDSAFPIVSNLESSLYDDPGMTLRDFFAAKAMQGFVLRGNLNSDMEAAERSYDLADAMLEARKPKEVPSD